MARDSRRGAQDAGSGGDRWGGRLRRCDAGRGVVGAATADDLTGWVPAAYRHRRVEPHVAARDVYDDVYPQYLGLYTDLRERFAAMAQRS